MSVSDRRPSPETLLAEAKNEHLGKLKIFLGAAPGVGKTYSMLRAAQTRISEGIDTVIGVVETHRRSETEALAQGITIIPRQKIDYRGLQFEEMDIDAILRRKPKLVLVDELAHTNIPGARHRKRYQDVQEILEAGIDVYSTLNIQHIESLNDIVARITGVTVRETVPDTIVQTANSIELIDLPPEELLQRLSEGKVYIPEQARLAMNRFFTPGNLTALRELALRQAAARVDEEMTSYMRRHAIAGPWPTSSRIMVCISDDGQASSLVRTARRSAERRQAPWLVLYVETSRHSFLPESKRSDIAQAMEIGQNMGAETMTITGENVASEILRIGRERNVSTIIIGKSVRSVWSRMARPSVAVAVLENAEGFDILLVNNREGRKQVSEQRSVSDTEARKWQPDWQAYGKGAFIIGIVSFIALIMSRLVMPSLLPFLYIIAVLMVVFELGLAVAAFSTVLGFVILDLIMNAPSLSLIPPQGGDLVALLFFLTTGLAISIIGDRLYRQVGITRRNAERTQALYEFTKNIATAATIDDVAQITTRRIGSALGTQTALLVPRADHLEIIAAVPIDLHLDTASSAAMEWAWQHAKPAGFRSDTLPTASFYGLPLIAGTTTLGVLAIKGEEGKIFSSDQKHFLNSLVYQVAAAIERAKLVTDVTQARLQSETEKLRASLLSSISYDLRAPLDNIISATRDLNKRWLDIEPAQQLMLLGSVESEAGRLDRFVQNLLDMTELVTGNIRLTRKPLSVKDLIEKVLGRLKRQIGIRVVQVDIPETLPLIDGDERTLMRVFINVLENACTYSPAEQPITISARAKGPNIRIAVTDHGPGIPESERERVFDMFYRVKSGAQQPAAGGIGLGLSICRGFVEAHQGTIKAQPGEGNVGTSIIIRLPVSATEQAQPDHPPGAAPAGDHS